MMMIMMMMLMMLMMIMVMMIKIDNVHDCVPFSFLMSFTLSEPWIDNSKYQSRARSIERTEREKHFTTHFESDCEKTETLVKVIHYINSENPKKNKKNTVKYVTYIYSSVKKKKRQKKYGKKIHTN